MRAAVNLSERTITCEFENYNGSNGMKSCSVTYFDEYCQEDILIINGVTDGDHVTLHYGDFLNIHTTYCYVIEANNGTLKVNIRGKYLQQEGNYSRVIAYYTQLVTLSSYNLQNLMEIIMMIVILLVGLMIGSLQLSLSFR